MFVHNISPVLFNLGPLEVRYYGLVYFLGFLITWLYLKKSKVCSRIFKKREHADDLLFYTLVSSMISARLFYILFYNFGFYFSNPLEVIKFWHGGMSIHGGILGGLFGIYYFTKKYKYSILKLTDLLVMPLAFFLFLGRIANFLNAELYGRVSSIRWAVKFPNAEGYRHPSQIYESLKNIIIFFTLLIRSKKPFKTGELTALFLIMYSVLRFGVEFFREPELYVLGLTMGQFLSVFVFLIGVYLYKTKI